MLKIAVCGIGNIGPAIAYFFATHAAVETLILLDYDLTLLQTTVSKLKTMAPSKQYKTIQFDIKQTTDTYLLNDVDLIAAALPWEATKNLINLATKNNLPLISITRPSYNELPALAELTSGKAPIVLGCGLEPGLTEIIALYLAEQFEILDELQIYCGGLSQKPNPPFNYKRIFGHKLPLDQRDAYYIEEGNLYTVPRFSGVERVSISPIGELEAWHDGMLPWLIEYPKIHSIKRCTQKTLRWPGFTESINVLRKCGFLSDIPIVYEDKAIIPRTFTETILHPHTNFDFTVDRDMTILFIKVLGSDGLGRDIQKTFLLTDNFDEHNQFTSIARTTGFTLGYAAIELLKYKEYFHGLIRPEQLLKRRRVESLFKSLKRQRMKINVQEKVLV
jgi:lysine 6-dehydrogenase